MGLDWDAPDLPSAEPNVQMELSLTTPSTQVFGD